MSNACSQIDAVLDDYANLVKVKSVQATLDKAWKNFAENASPYRSLQDENSIEIHEVDTQYVTQETKKLQCDLKIEEYTVISATHFNEEVSQDFANFGMVSPARSLRSASSRASSILSEVCARLHDTRTAAAKAALAAKQTEQKRRRSIEIEVKRLKMEMSQKQLELEMVKLEAEKDVAEAKERTKVAKLEGELAKNEYSELMLNANSSSHHSRFPPGLAFANSCNSSSLTTPPTSTQVYTFPVMNMQAHRTSAASARVYTSPAKSTQVDTLSCVSTQAYTISVASTRAYTLPAPSTQALLLRAVFELPPLSTQVYTRPVVSTQVTAFPATFPCVRVSQATFTQVPLVSASSLQIPRFLEVSSRGSSFPVGPLMFSAATNTADLSCTCVVHSQDSLAPPYPLATGSSAAAHGYNYTAVQRSLLTAPFTYSRACRRNPSSYDCHYHGEDECS